MRMMLKRLIIGVMMVTGVVNVCLTRVKVGRRRRNEDILDSTTPAEMGSNKLNFQRMFPYRKTENAQQQTWPLPQCRPPTVSPLPECSLLDPSAAATGETGFQNLWNLTQTLAGTGHSSDLESTNTKNFSEQARAAAICWSKILIQKAAELVFVCCVSFFLRKKTQQVQMVSAFAFVAPDQ